MVEGLEEFKVICECLKNVYLVDKLIEFNI